MPRQSPPNRINIQHHHHHHHITICLSTRQMVRHHRPFNKTLVPGGDANHLSFNKAMAGSIRQVEFPSPSAATIAMMTTNKSKEHLREPLSFTSGLNRWFPLIKTSTTNSSEHSQSQSNHLEFTHPSFANCLVFQAFNCLIS